MSEKHSIEDVIKHYGGKLPYGRNGWVKMRCCFHDDSHASAVINLQENVFKCFACDAQGDTYDIIMQQEGISFVKAKQFAEGISPASGAELRSGRRAGGTISGRKKSISGRRGSLLDRSS
jgi:DNA primase